MARRSARTLRTLPAVDRRERRGVARAKGCIPTRVPEEASRRSPYSLIFPPALALTVDPVTAALILVDVQPASGVCTGTGLDELLRNAGVTTVILAGVSFDGGIEGSARSLVDRGYGLILAPDACVMFDAHLQQGLWGMQTGIINVLSTEELVRRIASAGAVQVGRAGR